MGVKRDYVKAAVSTIIKMNPKLDKDTVEEIVIKKMKKKMTNPTIHLDNNVTGEHVETNLIDLCNYIEKRKPVISGNATMYMQPEELTSPTSNMLRDLKRARKKIKKEMFKYQPTDDEYQRLDLAQNNAKVIMNAEYGASGAPTAAFYTKYSPAATTLMAQSIITTMAAFFEGYVGDNMKFFHINECIDWMNTVCKKDSKIQKWIIVPSKDELKIRIKTLFFGYNFEYDRTIDSYIDGCTREEIIYLYYANNIRDFITRHKKVQDLIHRILAALPLYEASADAIPNQFSGQFESLKKYNSWVSKEMFLNPYDIPKIIGNEMRDLTELMNQYCFVEYLVPDSIAKLNNHKRNTILLVDTDSNVINANIFVELILNDLFPGQTFGRDKMYNEMICVNILASILDHCVINILDFYGRAHNMGPDARAELTMKNEFMFRRFFLMNKKKRYATSVVLREGDIMIPFHTEIKGLDFIKAGVTEDVTKKFTKMLKDHILFSEDLQLHELMKELKRFEKEIYKDLCQGGVRFLKPQMYKSEEAYKSDRVWQLPVFRAAAIWNEIYPDQKIYSMDRVKILKLVVTCLQDLDTIKDDYPQEYELIKQKVFENSHPEIQKAGLKVIAIPSNVKEIPEWLIDLIDYDVIISDNIGSFRSVLEALKIEEINMKTPNGKANITSSLISI